MARPWQFNLDHLKVLDLLTAVRIRHQVMFHKLTFLQRIASCPFNQAIRNLVLDAEGAVRVIAQHLNRYGRLQVAVPHGILKLGFRKLLGVGGSAVVQDALVKIDVAMSLHLYDIMAP